jgi:hypothetical protein
MFVQNTVVEPLIEADNLEEKIAQKVAEGYTQIVVTSLDAAAEPRTYGLNASRVIEE